MSDIYPIDPFGRAVSKAISILLEPDSEYAICYWNSVAATKLPGYFVIILCNLSEKKIQMSATSVAVI